VPNHCTTELLRHFVSKDQGKDSDGVVWSSHFHANGREKGLRERSTLLFHRFSCFLQNQPALCNSSKFADDMSFARQASRLDTECCESPILVKRFDRGGDGMGDAAMWYGRLVWGYLELYSVVDVKNAANCQQVRSR
jgi:hypothetical protein